MDFDITNISGTIPARSNEKKVPVLAQPTWISSTIIKISYLSHNARTPCRYSLENTCTPPSACTVSIMIAAGFSTPEWSSVSNVSIYLIVSSSGNIYGAGICVTSFRHTPAPPRLPASLVRDNAPSVIPWKHPMSAQIWFLFFTLRASFNAASTPLVPVGPGNITLKFNPLGCNTFSSKNCKNSFFGTVIISIECIIPSLIRYATIFSLI